MDYKASYFTAAGVPVVGSGDLTLRLQRDLDFWFLDFNDMAFKAAGHVAINLALAEPDAVNAPGWYWGNVLDAAIATWNDGMYTVYIICAGVAVPPPWQDIMEFRIYDGQVSSGIAEALGTQAQADILALGIDAGVDLQRALETILSWGAGNGAKVGNVLTFQNQAGVNRLRRTYTSTAIISQILP